MSIKKFYVICDYKNGDLFSTVYADKKTALKNAELQFAMFTKNDRNKRSQYYVCESITADVTSPEFACGQVVRRYI